MHRASSFDNKFIDNHLRRCVKVLFPVVPLRVNFESVSVRKPEMFYTIVEQIDLQNLIQIRMTQVNDHSKMFISTIDNAAYEQIRTEQSLHVTFQGFVDHLIKILDNCKREELHLALVAGSNGHMLQIFEKSSFKNLTHLFLAMEDASTDTVLFHINQSLQILQEQASAYSAQAQKYQLEMSTKNDVIGRLKEEIMSLNGKIMEQENLIFNRNTEEVSRLHQTIKNLNESKDVEEKRLKSIMHSMQEKIDHLTKETYDRTERMVQETKRFETLREENIKLRAQNTQIREELERLQACIASQQSRESRSETTVAELKRQLMDMQSKLKIAQKQQSELEAELEAEKNICHTKKHALQLTTDELANASSVINNLNKENIKLQSKIDLRTEIAMRQEKLLVEKEKQLVELSNTVAAIQQEHMKNRSSREEYAEMVKRIRETTDLIEEKYRKKINDMIHKLTNNQIVETTSVLSVNGKYLRPQNRVE
ncbi:spindle assembly abnormal protein 6 homolog isoform X1 [Anopheles stephensi]|uniref:spindle assembly abnormal protein 6 homolog isoform X1 n=2 Tax=Anopheles stephensi TaxID=30069 RepID=UPI0016589814|nr:spindle assembly abnormal protein 6 homolog isoform X1 [Anopheles stephensi]